MILKELIRSLPVEIKGSQSVEIKSLTADSRLCLPGSLFFAKKGTLLDGTAYIPQAIENGAVAIVVDLYNPFLGLISQIIHPHPEELEPLLAARFYKNPSRELFVFGVTGTNGKTTTAYLAKQLLDYLGIASGLLSTVETVIGERRRSSSLTTHDVITNQKYLWEMREMNQRAVALEVSSHGLSQYRVDEIDFDVALFTNLTPDHLDYHATIEEYALAKKRLFHLLERSKKKHKCAIVNADDSRSKQLLEGIDVPSLSFGLGSGADLFADEIETTVFGTTFRVHHRDLSALFQTSMIGDFNVSNLLGTIALGTHLGSSLDAMVPFVKAVHGAPGRLERVAEGRSFFVDYAHTEDALDQVLRTLRKITRGRLIVVFGAGGGRDKGRRSGLARAAEHSADFSIVTSDNPRQEDPEEIIRQILEGFSSLSAVRVEIDRRKAIQQAVLLAQPDDLVLIAGKGHEYVQIFSHGTVPFDDRAVVREFL